MAFMCEQIFLGSSNVYFLVWGLEQINVTQIWRNYVSLYSMVAKQNVAKLQSSLPP
jgi:hypothetical protein